MSRRGGDGDSRDGVNRPDNHRRKWDKDEFEKKAKERDDEEKEKRREHAKGKQDAATIRATAKASGQLESDDDDWDALDEDWEGIHKKSSIPRSKRDEPPVKRKTLSQRDYKVDLDSKLGKSSVITKNTPSSQSGGYYCNVCDCVVKDSINFLDHINGKKHQRNLGMSMRIERSSVDQVKARFALNKKKLEEKKKDYDLEQRTSEMREEEEKLREYRREKKKDKKRKMDDDHSGGHGSEDMMAMMGFGGFGGSKKT